MTKYFLALFMMLAATTARADLLLEPYAGYAFGHEDQGSSSHSTNGWNLGGRVGWTSMGFMLGADYMTGSWTDDASPKTTITPNDIGIFVGYKFPLLLRVYGEYIFNSDPKRTNSSGNDKPDGSAIKLGAQFTGLPFVAIGAEYYKGTYTKDKNSGTNYTNDLTLDYIALTVSVPFTL